MTRKTRVYVAGPYSRGDVATNVHDAIDAGESLLRAGFAPYVPHLTHFWHMFYPQRWQVWIDHNLEWLRACDVVLRLFGESKGADIEVAEAKRLGIKVFEDIDDVLGMPREVEA